MKILPEVAIEPSGKQLTYVVRFLAVSRSPEGQGFPSKAYLLGVSRS